MWLGCGESWGFSWVGCGGGVLSGMGVDLGWSEKRLMVKGNNQGTQTETVKEKENR